jgi:hypothetical protein
MTASLPNINKMQKPYELRAALRVEVLFVSVWNACPESPPSQTLDRSGRLTWLALAGYPRLAADTLLNRANQGRIEVVVGNAVRQLNLAFVKDPGCREKCYEVVLEAALNLVGMERRRAGFSDEETESALRVLTEALKDWEAYERTGGEAKAAIQGMLLEMKSVLAGQSMVAKMGEEIEKSLDDENMLESFIAAARRTIEGNVYYRMVDGGLSKLGNDSATGLRWLRHLGAVQVSSNPVIAARAFEEMSGLWQEFKVVALAHPEWFKNPETFADEITMYGTVTSLLPNVLDFRPIALLSDFHEGMVSIQLNPFKAGSFEGSREDALKIYTILEAVLARYDSFLMGEADFEGRGRPNVVLKVSGGDAAAISITEDLNSMGLGTNNTLTYTVAQEVRLTISAFGGLSRALKMGIPVTRVYITNMEGRLEDHLRQIEASRLLEASLGTGREQEIRVRAIADKLGALNAVGSANAVREKVAILCAKKYLKSLTDGWFAEAVRQGSLEFLEQMERDIRMAGILVTRRVHQLVFGQEVASRWMKYIQQEFGVSEEEASVALSMVDLLPASKRRAQDTFLVLGGKQITNLTNTEFPDQQLKVWLQAQQDGFRISDYENSILVQPDVATLERLLNIADFRKAYELTPELVAALERAGIHVPAEDGGISPEDWSSYGPVIRTADEFKEAYVNFKNKLLGFLKEAQR